MNKFKKNISRSPNQTNNKINQHVFPNIKTISNNQTSINKSNIPYPGSPNSNSQKLKDILNEFEDFDLQNSSIMIDSGFKERQWLKLHGKEDRITFKDEEIKQLRKYFNSLDTDGSGSIEVQELEEPLIALGLCASRDEVQRLINEVDDDGSGKIEFKEFLEIMSSGKKNDLEEKSLIYNFFKKMANGKLVDTMDSAIPFRLNVSQFRRKKLLDAIMSQDKEKRDKGQKILQAFKKQIIISKYADVNEQILEVPPNKDNDVNTMKGFMKKERIVESDKNTVQLKKSEKK